MTLSIARRHAGTTARSRTFFGLFEHTRRKGAQSGPLPQPNTPQLENREFCRDGQDEQDKSLNASLILFILSIPVKFLLLELSARNLASKTRNRGISMKKEKKQKFSKPLIRSFSSLRLRAFASLR
jgi:hypothetical protein